MQKTIGEIIKEREVKEINSKDYEKKELKKNKELIHSMVGKCFKYNAGDYIKFLSITEEREYGADFKCISFSFFKSDFKHLTHIKTIHNGIVGFNVSSLKIMKEIDEKTFNDYYNDVNNVNSVHEDIISYVNNCNVNNTFKLKKYVNILKYGYYDINEIEIEDLKLTETQIKLKYRNKLMEEIQCFSNKVLVNRNYKGDYKILFINWVNKNNTINVTEINLYTSINNVSYMIYEYIDYDIFILDEELSSNYKVSNNRGELIALKNKLWHCKC